MAESLDVWNLDIREEDIIKCYADEAGEICKDEGSSGENRELCKYNHQGLISYWNTRSINYITWKKINVPKTRIFNGKSYYKFSIIKDHLQILETFNTYKINGKNTDKIRCDVNKKMQQLDIVVFINVNNLSVDLLHSNQITKYINLSSISTLDFHECKKCNLVINDKIYRNISKDIFEKFKAEYEAYISKSRVLI